MGLSFNPIAISSTMIDHYPTLCYHTVDGKRSNGYTGIKPHFEHDFEYGY